MGDQEPQLDVSWVGPSTVLVIIVKEHIEASAVPVFYLAILLGWADWLDSVAGLTGMAGSKGLRSRSAF